MIEEISCFKAGMQHLSIQGRDEESPSFIVAVDFNSDNLWCRLFPNVQHRSHHPGRCDQTLSCSHLFFSGYKAHTVHADIRLAQVEIMAETGSSSLEGGPTVHLKILGCIRIAFTLSVVGFIVKLVDHVVREATIEMFSNQNPRLDHTMEGQQSLICKHG